MNLEITTGQPSVIPPGRYYYSQCLGSDDKETISLTRNPRLIAQVTFPNEDLASIMVLILLVAGIASIIVGVSRVEQWHVVIGIALILAIFGIGPWRKSNIRSKRLCVQQDLLTLIEDGKLIGPISGNHHDPRVAVLAALPLQTVASGGCDTEIDAFLANTKSDADYVHQRDLATDRELHLQNIRGLGHDLVATITNP